MSRMVSGMPVFRVTMPRLHKGQMIGSSKSPLVDALPTNWVSWSATKVVAPSSVGVVPTKTRGAEIWRDLPGGGTMIQLDLVHLYQRRVNSRPRESAPRTYDSQLRGGVKAATFSTGTTILIHPAALWSQASSRGGILATMDRPRPRDRS